RQFTIFLYCHLYVVRLLFPLFLSLFTFFFTAPSTSQIYTLSLHDALPISISTLKMNRCSLYSKQFLLTKHCLPRFWTHNLVFFRSEEHTSELQSRFDLVCRLLLEKKKKTTNNKRVQYVPIDALVVRYNTDV